MALTCDPNGPIPLSPRPWSQAGGDKENSGFNPVHTTFALSQNRKWTAGVGQLVHSGPVIGPDGVIYVGNRAGELVAINPDGSERWRRKVDETIQTSPVVNPENGDIFVVGQQNRVELGLRSRLHHLDSGAGLHGSSMTDFVGLAAPKMWRNFVFLPVMLPGDRDFDTLLVFDQGNVLVPMGQTKVGCINLVCGSGGIGEFLLGVINFAICAVTFDAECLSPKPGFAPFTMPSVAIVDSANLVADPNKPTVVVVTGQCVNAYRFHPQGDGPPPFNPHFEPLWGRVLVEENCDGDTVASTSPLVLGGQVVLGDENGRVLSLDVADGHTLWSKNGSPVIATPVAAVRQIYVPRTSGLDVLDSDGDFLTTVDASGTSAAISLDFIYVADFGGIQTVAQFPSVGFFRNASTAVGSGSRIPTPAISPDGTVYLTTPDGVLHAFGD